MGGGPEILAPPPPPPVPWNAIGLPEALGAPAETYHQVLAAGTPEVAAAGDTGSLSAPGRVRLTGILSGPAVAAGLRALPRSVTGP